MRSQPLFFLCFLFLLCGCAKMRIQSDSQIDIRQKITPHLTSQTNYQRNAIALEQIPPPLSLLWDEEFISLPSRGFTALENLLIFGSYRGHIIFVDMQTGKMKGKENYGDSCPVPPTIYDFILYQPFEAGSHGLVAYDLKEGDDLWEVDNQNSKSSPLVIENKVYHLSAFGVLSCYHFRTGDLIWSKALGSRVQNSPAFKDKMIIAATIIGNIFAIEYTSGNIKWQADIDAPVMADPVIANERTYIAGYDGSLTVFDLGNGDVLEKKNFPAPLYVAPTIDNSNIYLPVSDGNLVVFDEKTFAHKWTFLAKGPPSDAVLVSEAFVYLASLENRLYILNKTNGQMLQEIILEGRPRGTPVITGGRLFISSEDNRIEAYAAQSDSI